MLDHILDRTRERVDALAPLEHSLRQAARSAPAVRDFEDALRSSGLAVVAEIKRRSPSAGVLAPALDPAEQAAAYVAGGAAAISVLTEPEFFSGTLEDLRAVRTAVEVPVLRKDFTLHPAQIWEARAAGADAVLLIVAALSDEELRALLAVARETGMAALVEAHTPDEALRAVTAGAPLIGVNNRDLTTFVTDLTTAESIAPLLPAGVVRVAESGVSTAEGAARMRRAGYHAILVGEALVRATDPAALVSRLRG